MTTSDLPALNAVLNGVAAVLLLYGRSAIRDRQRDKHRGLMLGALGVSALFLTSYLTYHFLHASTRFTAQGPIRWVYFTLLISHVVLATANLPLILMTLIRALKGQFEAHRKIARFTWWSWLYVSLTGVVVYAMLYHLWPGQPGSAFVGN